MKRAITFGRISSIAVDELQKAYISTRDTSAYLQYINIDQGWATDAAAVSAVAARIQKIIDEDLFGAYAKGMTWISK